MRRSCDLIETRELSRGLRSILIFNNEGVCESPVEGAFEGNFACEVEATKSIKHISTNNPKSFKIKHSVNVNVNTRAKENPIKAVMRW